MFSANETADVGIDLGAPVVEAIGAAHKSCFTGHVPRVMVEVKPPAAGSIRNGRSPGGR